jgi:CubicO group peptidase (beta-lactamase class C family)
MRFGMGYGLGGELIPMGPRACFWGGMGGSIIVMDQETRLTVCYIMNKMAPDIIGDTRGFDLAMAAVMGAVGAAS